MRCSTPTLRLCYNWPLLPLYSDHEAAIESEQLAILTRVGEILLAMRECPISSLSTSSQFKKRKRDDLEEEVLRDCKRIRLNSSSPMLMLNFNWTLVFSDIFK